MFPENLTQIRNSKKGFTLVELLVSMAIIIFMLSIMSQAFVIATTCMSGLKGVGELLDKGRPVLAVLQKDLSAYHFDGNKRLSDPDFWENGPPRQGYFKISEGGNTAVEGFTTDGVTYQRSGSTSNHRLAFTSRLNGKNPEDFYVTAFEQYNPLSDYNSLVGLFNSGSTLKTSKNSQRYDFTSGVLHSQWAEIAYFTIANNRNANGTPLMDLYRQQKAVLPSNAEANGLSAGFPISDTMPTPPYPPFTSKMPYYENFSYKPLNAGNISFNSPFDLTKPNYRMLSGLPNTLYANSDLLITDVISFDVRILPDSSLQDFSLISSLPAFGYTLLRNEFDTWTTGNDGTQYDIGSFDTGVWQPNAINPANVRIPIWNYGASKGLRINAIQVSIRIWDEKSQKAREFKIIQRI